MDEKFRKAVTNFDEEHEIERIILIGKDNAIRQIILEGEVDEN